MKILFAASEAYPLVKTGGLGDVIYSLPRTLKEAGADVRVILPAYRSVLEKAPESRIIAWMDVTGDGRTHSVRILESRDTSLGTPLYLVDCPELFGRPGNPYLHPDGYDWPDNAERYAVFSRAVAAISCSQPDIDWRPDVVHTHDWQTGLIPALLKHQEDAPRSVFTIHNLAYGGIFSYQDYINLGLPEYWWSAEGLEFHGNFSMLKAGLIYADQVTTVSPTYAREILTPQFGYGFEGVLHAIDYKLSGILNGVDQDAWNPKSDPYLPSHYAVNWRTFKGKCDNKAALLTEMGLEATDERLHAPLFGLIGRLVEQKGIDLVAEVIPRIIETSDASFIILGSGQDAYEYAFTALARRYPEQVLLYLGYSEELAHRIEAGADFFLMPSRFEPCGLNQLYSLRYGTPPIVHHTGGLADTVVDTNDETFAHKKATGYVFHEPTADALQHAIERAIGCYQNDYCWKQIVRTGMQQDFSWTQSAASYLSLYQQQEQ
ncbi:MAG: glycogen synthase GlgA, partial [Pseudomonadota bacterium]